MRSILQLVVFPALLASLSACSDGKNTDTKTDTGTRGPTSGIDTDRDGYDADVDCDDGDATVHPDADETCDGVDDDCDGATDEEPTDGTVWYSDADADGYGDDSTGAAACDQPAGTSDLGGDCDDGDGAINPAADELCDGIDNNCDGTIDEGEITLYTDGDGDGYGDPQTSFTACGPVEGAVANGDDCDDGNRDVSPSATEVCNGIDDDCDGAIDDADNSLDTSTLLTWYEDADGDGYGDSYRYDFACSAPEGFVADDTDCDDDDGAVSPGSPELCDGKDDDCDGSTDEADAADASTWYADTDRDGYGDAGSAQIACTAPAGYVADSADCDDTDAGVSPADVETCDGEDDDCDGTIDEDDARDATTWYADTDGDGYGDAGSTHVSCSAPAGYVADSSDCDDSSATTSPAGTEVCDGVDNDCDGTVDDNPTDGTTYYADADSDGYGDASHTRVACSVPSGYTTNRSDCDDTRSGTNPGAYEVCDGRDNDCDGSIDESAIDMITYFRDADGDGYGSTSGTVTSCSAPSGYASSNNDCDDTDSGVNPGAYEYCDGEDDDCDGSIDEGAVDFVTWYRDADGDGFGDPGTATTGCSAPSGYVSNDDDCDDTDATVLDPSTFQADADGDGFGDPDNVATTCDGVDNSLDCDDSDAGEPVVVDGARGSWTNPGTYDRPLSLIQDGIDLASECVIVYGGTYTEAIDFNGHNVAVTGVDGADATIIDASGTGSPAVTFDGGETASAGLSGFTITGGEGHLATTTSSYACTSVTTCTDYYSTYCGGGVYVSGSDPTLTDLLVEANTLPSASTTTSGNDTYYVYSFGGGVCLEDSAAALSGVDVKENYADQGGGVYVDETSVVTFDQSWIMSNTSTDGGGVQVDGGTLYADNLASLWNEATGDGGGLLLIDADLDAAQITWAGDDAVSGGGLYASGTSRATVINSIVYGAATGAGVLADATATFTGRYNDVYGNTGGNYSGTSDVTGSNGNVSSNPRFNSWSADGIPTNDDITLSSASPAKNSGDPTTYDADGTRADMGAFGGANSDWN